MKKSHLRRCAMRRMTQEISILSGSGIGGTKLSLFALLVGTAIGTGTAEADCFVDPAGTTINCQGTDAADGVAFNNPPCDTLNVNSLSADVSPPAGTTGEVLEGFCGDGGNGGGNYFINYNYKTTLTKRG